jgi:hypothetical protein
LRTEGVVYIEKFKWFLLFNISPETFMGKDCKYNEREVYTVALFVPKKAWGFMILHF